MHLILDIDTNQINDKIIKKLLEMHKEEISRYENLENYYRGEHNILNRKSDDTSKPNNKLVHDFPGYIIDTLQGYFMGKPVRYSSENEEMMEKIQDILDYNDEQDENSELAKDSGIKGTTYELLYFDEDAEIRFNVVNPKNLIMIYDTTLEHKPLMAIRYYESLNILTDKTIKMIEVYTKDFIINYKEDNNNLEMTDIRDNYFGDVPVVEFSNNDERLGDFEKVISLIDSYNKANSDTMNDIEYFADAYLVLYGMPDTDSEDIKQAKKDRVLIMGDEKGKAEWLVKNFNDTFLENAKKRLQSDTHKFSKVPDLSDEQFSGNASGIALAFKLWGMEQVAVTKERKFKRGLQRRLELIFNALRTKGFNYDYRDIKLSFVRNIPHNIKEIAEIMNILQGILSDESIVAMFPDVEDPQAEIEKRETELLERIEKGRANLNRDKTDIEDDEDELRETVQTSTEAP